jgi:hypothetical protein
VHRGEIGDERLEAHILQPEPLGDRARELVGADEPLLEQDPPHRAPGGARLADDVLDGVAVADAEADDDVAEQPAWTDAKWWIRAPRGPYRQVARKHRPRRGVGVRAR